MSILKKQIKIRIEADHGDGGRVVRTVRGEWYGKEGAEYIRYHEPEPDMGNTTATIRLTNEEVRVIRHGDFRSEQAFAEGRADTGYFETPQGRMVIENRTLRFDNRSEQGNGTVEWKYEMIAGGEAVGTYTLKMTMQEEK
ncbi:DUF1934 domain-containing protein [Paenibacillus turpanensis]|uniref:DUF1934 domain-containing protein n=1 Tax=Paenibacillus turpanensis TaxID=2689078 RepID=UPI00140B0A75|nr:DUF1934 family protein [Paenibacillus turpanensis]